MAFTADDVEEWLVDQSFVDGIDDDLIARVIAAVNAHAARHYDLDDAGDGTDDERDQALIMECARLYMRKHSQTGYVGSDEHGPITVRQFDPDVRALLSGRLITAGMFGPSANTSS